MLVENHLTRRTAPAVLGAACRARHLGLACAAFRCVLGCLEAGDDLLAAGRGGGPMNDEDPEWLRSAADAIAGFLVLAFA